MSARVNLLPREVEARRRAQRVMGVTVGVVLLFVVLLGVLYMLKLNEIKQAEEERDAVQAEVAQLEAEIAQLEEFRQLANQLEARNAMLAEAMAAEVSFARVLNDLSLAFPASSSLRSLTGTLQDTEDAPGDVQFGRSVASLTFDGYSVERYAPGVETVLVEFDKVRIFFHPYLSTAQEEEIGATGVHGFNGSVELNEDAYTRRYEDGLPEEVGR